MIRVVIFDLGDTLVENSKPFPHVVEALDALGRMRLADGASPKRLTLLLVSDFTMVDPPVTKVKTTALVKEYLALLEGFGLRRFFTPVSKRITLSTQVGVFKPDRRIYEAALERSATRATLNECLAITENGAHLAACRDLGMATLHFGHDFTDWSNGLAMVTDLVHGSAAADSSEQALFVRSLELHGQVGDTVGPVGGTVGSVVGSATHVRGKDGAGVERTRFTAI